MRGYSLLKHPGEVLLLNFRYRREIGNSQILRKSPTEKHKQDQCCQLSSKEKQRAALHLSGEKVFHTDSPSEATIPEWS